MPDLDELLQIVAVGRRGDPLAPVTVLVPSHVAALQFRRRLAELGPFAAVRFEPLARIAELIGAGELAVAGRVPLARPIADYLAERVAVESRGTLADVGDLPGYARILRQLFRRLRRGGIRASTDLAGAPPAGHLAEVLRLYDRFRAETAQFYDEDDLFDAAASVVRAGAAAVLRELGAIYALPALDRSASAANLLDALRDAAADFVQVDEMPSQPSTRFVIAPDPASEVREAVREVLDALASGVALHEIAILHGAAANYRPLLRDTLAAAGIPTLLTPGTPLIETPVGRAVLNMALLPGQDYARTATMELLALAPLRRSIAATGGAVATRVSVWDRISREAGVTHGMVRWSPALNSSLARLEQDIEQLENDDSRRPHREFEREATRDLLGVIEHLAGLLEPLRAEQPAHAFIAAFAAIIGDYLDPEAGALERVLAEVEQLGTIAAVGGSFSLGSFARALRANLEAASTEREHKFGDGIFVAHYTSAAGLRFARVILCGAHEGGFPTGPGADALVEDRAWAALRRDHPYVEDAALRIERSTAAAQRAIAAAGGGELIWCAPLYEPGGTREYHPAPLMVEAAARHDATITSGSALRGHSAAAGWLRRGSSPLAMQLLGSVVDAGELRLREAIAVRKHHRAIGRDHRLSPAVEMITARRSDRFTEWEGNLSELADDGWFELQAAVSPTSLERYGACGFRYLCGSLLRLQTVEEPEGRETMEGSDRGTLVHHVLDAFFKERQAQGRPRVGEAWTDADRIRLLEIADLELDDATRRGLTGLHIYSGHLRRTLHADLAAFLEADTTFRRATGAVPSDFEARVPEVTIAGVRLRGIVDRIDRTPDGRCAWVLDYKTGALDDYKGIAADNPFDGGTKLQLPTYLNAAADADEQHALYWFMTQKGGFEQIAYEPTAETEAAFERTIGAIVGGIRAGAFPAVPGELDEFYGSYENCKFCDYTRICSRRRDDAFAEKSGDAAVAPWLAVALAAAVAPEPTS